MNSPVRVCIIGAGSMALGHIRRMLQQQATTRIVAICEPSPMAYTLVTEIFKEAGLEAPPNQPDLRRLLEEYGDQLDAALIITPHAYHHDQTLMCMEAGLDVLLEKPMVMNVPEALSLIDARDRLGRLLVIAFQGSLSPQIRRAAAMLRAGELGNILSISGTVWQNWGPNTANTWRQVPELAGGGFLFDTGAHMLNTVADLAGEDFVEVGAWLDKRDRPVETMGTVMGRLQSGALVTIHACGETIPSCASDIRVFCEKGILRTGQWGERLDLQRYGRKNLRPVPVPASTGVWEQFLAVRNGVIDNPSPPEIGLRMTRLWDAIKDSAAQGGAPVQCAPALITQGA
jgi:predicted dehydrogenase